MFTKCIVFLAAVAQIYASPCCKIGCAAPAPVALPAVAAPCARAAPVAVPAVSSGTGGAIVKNVVAKGKYPVALRNCGATPDKQIPVVTSRVNTPPQVKPTVRLPCNIPAPRTVCHSCTCYKTVLRPRVNQQIITVPTIERYIENSHKPVIENIQYEAIPINCGGDCGPTGLQFIEVGCGAAPVAPCAPVLPTPVASCAPVLPTPVASCAPILPAPVAPCASVLPAPITSCASVVPRLPCGCF